MVRIHLRARWVAVVSALVVGLLSGCKTTPNRFAAPVASPSTSVGQPAATAPAAEPKPVPTLEDAPLPASPPVVQVQPPIAVPATPSPEPAPSPAPSIAVNSNGELKPATLLGSEETSTMLDNLTVYVVSVDDRNLSAGRDSWNTPLKIKAGPRRIGVAFTRGVFSAGTELRFEAKPGAAYQVKFATDAQLFGRNTYCEFWIEEVSTGNRTVEPTRVALRRNTNGH